MLYCPALFITTLNNQQKNLKEIFTNNKTKTACIIYYREYIYFFVFKAVKVAKTAVNNFRVKKSV